MATGDINPGYSTVVDSEIGAYTNHNAQSVILEAPRIGNSQSNISAFLNNGLTNAAPMMRQPPAASGSA